MIHRPGERDEDISGNIENIPAPCANHSDAIRWRLRRGETKAPAEDCVA
jgi:hypothetical protein